MHTDPDKKGPMSMTKTVTNPFAEPDMLDKLKEDARTRELVQDPSYLELLEALKTDPDGFGHYLSDPRVITTLSVLLQIDIQFGYEIGKFNSQSDSTILLSERKQMTIEELEEQALLEKRSGNEFYKKRDFPTALKHYERAVELDPGNIVLLNNIAAVYLEQKKYLRCVEQCDLAIEAGRENQADFKLIAKALVRRGNAYVKLRDFQQAKLSYEESLAEHQTEATRDLLAEVEKHIIKEDMLDKTDPIKAEEHNMLANESFTSGQYMSALENYTAAISYSPMEAKYFSNRAACFTKLQEYTNAMFDCERSIELNARFIKAYFRKAQIYQKIEQPVNALIEYQKVLSIEPDNMLAKHAMMVCQHAIDTSTEDIHRRAMNLSEVRAITSDPAMRKILGQVESDPNAWQEHLRDPDVLNKVRKLIDWDVIPK